MKKEKHIFLDEEIITRAYENDPTLASLLNPKVASTFKAPFAQTE